MGELARARALAPALGAILLFIACISSARAASDAERVAKLASTTASKPSAMLTFNIDTFTKYVESSPRSYSVFVYFSADESICQPCGAMERAVSQVAQEYRGLPARARARRPVFFAVLKLSGSDQAFLARYDIQRVPLFHHFSPTARAPAALVGADSYAVHTKGFGGNQLRHFVNERSGAQLPVVRGSYSVPFVATVRELRTILLGLAVIGVPIMFRTRAYAMPLFWFVCVVVVYIFSVGGGHYSWIHDTPLYTVNREGQFEFFANGARSQYAAEGFFVSATCVSISAFIILIQELPHFVDIKAVQGMAGLLLVAMTYIAISILLTLYHWKMPGYLVYNEI